MTIELLKGDCREILRELPEASFDCVITDPPYGQTSLAWDRAVIGWQGAVHRVLKPTGSMWVFGTLRHFMAFSGHFGGFQMSHDVIWEKHNGSGLFADRFRNVHEIAAHFYRDDAPWGGVYKAPQFTNDARSRVVRKKSRPAQWIGATGDSTYRSEDGGPLLMRSVQFARSEHGRAVHPTQKPLALIEPLLLYACPPGGRVLDPFAGSGGVGMLARRHGMDCTLIEANSDYWGVIEARLQDDAPLLTA